MTFLDVRFLSFDEKIDGVLSYWGSRGSKLVKLIQVWFVSQVIAGKFILFGKISKKPAQKKLITAPLGVGA